ncbi:hypothetical protein LCGC14_2745390, partial [marine sediment metagenome]
LPELNSTCTVFSKSQKPIGPLASTVYVLRDFVQPTTPNNNFTYRCTTAGTTGASEPTFPTTAGGTVSDGSVVWTAVDFDYEYEDDYAATSHPFFRKIYRTRLVLPNKYIVKSTDSASPGYEGSATSAASFALLPKTEPIQLGLISNAQATAIAEALIQRAELDHERGSLFAPMNVGAEAHDYVKVTDNVEGDNRIGNTGYLTRFFEAGDFNFSFGFGDILLGSSIGTGGLVGGTGAGGVSDVLTISQNFHTLSSELADISRVLDIVLSNQKIIAKHIDSHHNEFTTKSLTATEDATCPTEPA